MTRRLTTIALLLTLWTPPWLYAGEPPFTVLTPTETIQTPTDAGDQAPPTTTFSENETQRFRFVHCLIVTLPGDSGVIVTG